MTAYYNEIDPYAAAWLRNLIAAGHIAPGVVDTRSIEDVLPSDLAGFTQCHFFAGIGVWSYALRRAGWSDDRPVWTGSCPCQPFSAAGQGAGFADERHLWPAWHHLISECRPPAVFGEQVASADAGPWLDLVQDDMEALGYPFGAVPFPSAGVGAPHIRDRLYWLANANGIARGQGRPVNRGRHQGSDARARAGSGGGVLPGELADSQHVSQYGDARAVHRAQAENAGNGEHDHGSVGGGEAGRLQHPRHDDDASQDQAASAGQPQADRPADQLGGSGLPPGGLGHTDGEHTGRHTRAGDRSQAVSGLRQGGDLSGTPGADGGPGPTNGPWRDADWLLCRDGKWRPVEPGTFPLAHGAASRVGRLRAYGNAINAEAAIAFIQASGVIA